MRRAVTSVAIALLLTAAPAAALSTVATIAVGSQPFGVALAGDGTLYVANSGGSTVSVIDPASNTVVASVAVGGGPGEIAADPGAGRAYVANFNDGTVSVVDTAARTTVATLAPGGLGVAIDAGRSRLYAVVPSQLTVFDTVTLAPVATVAAPAGARWWSVAVDAQRQRAYVGDLAGGGVTVIDLTTNAVLSTIAVGGPVRFALATDPDRGRVLVATDTAPGTLSVIDAGTNAIVRSIALGGYPSHIAPVSASVVQVTEGGSDDVATVDPGSGTVTRVGAGPRPAGLASVGSRLYVALQGGASVAVLGNGAPVIDAVSIAPASPVTTDVLRATVTAHDPDGDALTFTYQWTRNGSDIAGATAATLDLGAPGNGDRGDAIAVRVTASDGTLTSAPRTAAAVTVADSAPVASVALGPSAPTSQTVLVATVTAADADGDALTFTYTWRVNGTIRRTLTTSATTDSFDLGRPGNGNKGDVVSVEVIPSDGTLTGQTAVASATIGRGH